MSVIKSLWASVQGNPVFMRRVNGWLTIFWIGMIPVSIVTGWVRSVAYISALSLWALVSGHWSAWQAARVEVTQQVEAEKLEAEPIEQKIVNKLVDETDVALQPATMQRAPTGPDLELQLTALTTQVTQLREALVGAGPPGARSM